jgi:uncharacterized protein YbaR (Trm112 family)
MALSKDLLEIICCPETRQPLALVASSIVDSFNEKNNPRRDYHEGTNIS